MDYGYKYPDGRTVHRIAALLGRDRINKGPDMSKSTRLPTRFPPGSKYVLESHGATVRRYVEFPDGRRVSLPARKALTCCAVDVSLVPKPADAPVQAGTARRRAKVLASGRPQPPLA